MTRADPAAAVSDLFVILPGLQDRVELAGLQNGLLTIHFLEDEAWPGFIEEPRRFDVNAYIDRIRPLVAARGRRAALFYSHDLAALIAAALCDELGLPGPTFESQLLACHKGYSRSLDSGGVRSAMIDLSDDEPPLPAFGTWPVFVKPAALQFSLLGARAENPAVLRAAVDRIKHQGEPWAKPYVDLFSRFADLNRYPLAARPVALVEEFVEAVSQHAVEGWTDADGVAHLWMLSDNNYFADDPLVLDNNSVSSRLPGERQADLFALAAATVRRMGLKSTFWNVEIWLLAGGELKITEVNSRIIASMSPIYRAVFGRSQYAAAVKLACGGAPTDAEMPGRAERAGAMVSLTSRIGGRTRALLDYRKLSEVGARATVAKISLMQSPTAVVGWSQPGGGVCLARAYLTGASHDAIEAEAAEIRSSCLASPIV